MLDFREVRQSLIDHEDLSLSRSVSEVPAGSDQPSDASGSVQSVACINPNSVANLSTAFTMSFLTSVFSFATDFLVYLVFHAAQNKSFPRAEEMKKLPFYAALGGFGASFFVWLCLMMSGYSAQLLMPEKKRMHFAFGATLSVNSMFAAALELVFDLGEESLMKVLISLGGGLALDLLLLSLFVACGNGEERTAKFVSDLHTSTEDALKNIIGPGSNFAESHYSGFLRDCGKGLLTSCPTSLWCCQRNSKEGSFESIESEEPRRSDASELASIMGVADPDNSYGSHHSGSHRGIKVK